MTMQRRVNTHGKFMTCVGCALTSPSEIPSDFSTWEPVAKPLGKLRIPDSTKLDNLLSTSLARLSTPLLISPPSPFFQYSSGGTVGLATSAATTLATACVGAGVGAGAARLSAASARQVVANREIMTVQNLNGFRFHLASKRTGETNGSNRVFIYFSQATVSSANSKVWTNVRRQSRHRCSERGL